ncbi:MAG: 7-cyano-7-deazaguanine synthase QueC [Muribaculaceae bacterium]|nr:7-cyano-7-deazaguanine synthase QueC [Muribaculaceae bacterium]
MEKDSVIILSGGVDSTTLLYYQKHRIALAVSFNYGSNHNGRELECARWQCSELGIEHLVIPLDFIGQYFQSSLLAGAEEIPKGDYDNENMKSTVVPFRNGIMLAIACGIAESRGLKHVMMANHGGDHAIYPDCRPEFTKAISEAMQAGTYERVTLIDPFTMYSKAEIVKLGKELGIDYSHTYSCYCGEELHCGECGTCRERKEAFNLAGMEDPVPYKSHS